MHKSAHIRTKNNDIFHTLSLGKGHYERESNPTPLPLYLYLPRSAFLVSFTDSNKQLRNVKSVFEFLNFGPSV